MKKNMDIIEKLQIVTERETKRRQQAVWYLEQIVEDLEPIFLEIVGGDAGNDETYAIRIPKFNKKEEKYIYSNSDLYFRYKKVIQEGNFCVDVDEVGFHINRHRPLWGEDLLEIKGIEFWTHVEQINNWLTNYLSTYIENKDESNQKNMDNLEKIIEKLEN